LGRPSTLASQVRLSGTAGPRSGKAHPGRPTLSAPPAAMRRDLR
jgi:hypothetical protein